MDDMEKRLQEIEAQLQANGRQLGDARLKYGELNNQIMTLGNSMCRLERDYNLLKQDYYSKKGADNVPNGAMPHIATPVQPQPAVPHVAVPVAQQPMQIRQPAPQPMAPQPAPQPMVPQPMAQQQQAPQPMAQPQPVPQPMAQQQPVPQPMAQPQPAPQPMAQQQQAPQPMAQQQPVLQPMQASQNEFEESFEIKRNQIPQDIPVSDNSVESKIGRKIMPVLAAGLIFVSVILFSIVFIPKMGDTFKQILFYGFGTALVAGGVVLKAKDKGGAFASVLASCGFGVLYVSILVSHLVFGSITQVGMFIAFLIWAVLLILFKKMGNMLFHVIGQTGILVSVCLGSVYACSNKDPLKFMMVIMYFIIAEILYYIFFDAAKELAHNVVLHSFTDVGIMFCQGVIFVALIIFPKDLTSAYGIEIILAMLILLSSALFVEKLITHRDKNGIMLLIFGTLSSIFTFVSLADLYIELPIQFTHIDLWMLSLVWCIVALIYIFVTEFARGGKIGTYIYQSAVILFCTIACLIEFAVDGAAFITWMFPALMIAFTALGFIRRNHVFKIAALMLYVLYAFTCSSGIMLCVVSVCFAAAYLLLLYLVKDSYNIGYKLAVLLTAMIYIANIVYFYVHGSFIDDYCEGMILACITAMNIAIMYTPLSKNKEEKFDIFYVNDAISLILVIASGISIFKSGSDANYICMLVIFANAMLYIFRGFAKKRDFEKILPIAALVYVLVLVNIPIWLKAACGAAIVITFMIMLYRVKEQYSSVVKNILYVLAMLYAVVCIYSVSGDIMQICENLNPVLKEEPVTTLLVIFAVAFISLIMNRTLLAKNKEGEEDIKAVSSIASVLLGVSAPLLLYRAKMPLVAYTLIGFVLVYSIYNIIVGFAKKSVPNKVLGLIPLLVVMMHTDYPVARAVTFFIPIILFFALSYIVKEQYSFAFKFVLYVFMIIGLIVFPINICVEEFEGMENSVYFNIVALSLAVFNLIMHYTPLSGNPNGESGNHDMRVVTYIVNHTFVCILTLATPFMDMPDVLIPTLLAVILMAVGIYKAWSSKNVWLGFSIAEVTIVPFILCYALEASGFVATLAVIAVAICCIVFGFIMKYVGPRLYGLIMTMIMIFKLTMIDYRHSSLLGYAVSFLIAGVVCLGISMLYYFINANVKKNEQE